MFVNEYWYKLGHVFNSYLNQLVGDLDALVGEYICVNKSVHNYIYIGKFIRFVNEH